MYIPSPFPVFCVVETRIGELSASQMPHNHVGLNLYYLKITLCTWVRAPQFAFIFLFFCCFLYVFFLVQFLLLRASIFCCTAGTATSALYLAMLQLLLTTSHPLTGYCSQLIIHALLFTTSSHAPVQVAKTTLARLHKRATPAETQKLEAKITYLEGKSSSWQETYKATTVMH
jgi:hypothetical protein